MRLYFIAFASTLISVLALTPLVRRLAARLGAVDVPEDRKVHETETPTLGGIAIYSSMMIGAAVYLIFGYSRVLRGDLAGILLGATVIVIFGAIDDIRGLSPLSKLFGQILGAGVLVIMGVQIQNINIPGVAVFSLSPELSVIISLIWVVAFINIINLIDGLDGLAAGITCIISFSMFYYVTQTGVGATFVDAALISILLAGATLGFLRYNFNPANVFMGDSGSMLLGYMLGAVTIQGVLKSIAAVALIIPVVALALPIADTGMAIMRRFRKGKPITHADKEHIHHKLLNMGHSQRQAVLLLYFWTALLCGTSLALKFMTNNKMMWIALGLVVGVFALTAIPRIVRGNGTGGKHRATSEAKGPRRGARRGPGRTGGTK
ncbi:MAG: undecaprenyl-phosphate alpha-N-acetylglucosaminyl 1-phosphate transferase [Candidatus Anoxymicrobium japonicum]|uniref:Undecaprenyl-phosphate alpha-N-acetylglucosaminyl 1-phosphate transferase n=1 Tax=Candidatus Anoxymicrobium japonicum TaxID=2013648 RepID=A0A2N3G4H2_9ACTN|nr:MAG: undecaprenyl-phosphate alpha-N-acetylglucosaminyl 1-phosphate transferase [Candidatus Anoxymicrobium japonicum]